MKTKSFLLFPALLLIFLTFISLQKKQEYCKIPVRGYKLVWHDDFTGSSLDLSKWNYILGERRDAFNSKEMVFLDEKGFLHIQAKKKGDLILAGMISSENLFATTYGYFECRAKLTKASGIWPAFWLQSGINIDHGTPEKNGAEIDIFEYFINLNRDSITHNLHWGGYGATHKELGFIYAPLKKTPDNFHSFGLEWTDTSYRTFVDGTETARGNTLISKVPQFILLSVECDKNAAGPLQVNALPDDFIVDYVRVYKKDMTPKRE